MRGNCRCPINVYIAFVCCQVKIDFNGRVFPLNALVSLDLFFNLITATMSSKFYIKNYTLAMATVGIEASSGMLRTNIPMESVIIYVGS